MLRDNRTPQGRGRPECLSSWRMLRGPSMLLGLSQRATTESCPYTLRGVLKIITNVHCELLALRTLSDQVQQELDDAVQNIYCPQKKFFALVDDSL